MFHSRSLNNKRNSLHERALRITYGDRSSSFENLLKKDNPVSIHHRNIQALTTEMFKVKINIAPEIMKVFFAPKMSSYKFRNKNSFKRRVKVGNAYISWKEYFHGIPQRSILGPLIFKIVLCDLFYFLEGVAVASYADDTTPYTANMRDLQLKPICSQFN